MNQEQLRDKLHANGVSAQIEICEDDRVLFKMSEGEYARLLKRHEFDGPKMRAALETIVGMGNTWHAMGGNWYELGFTGDIDEVHAREREYKRQSRIKNINSVLASVPRLQEELAELEAQEVNGE